MKIALCFILCITGFDCYSLDLDVKAAVNEYVESTAKPATSDESRLLIDYHKENVNKKIDQCYRMNSINVKGIRKAQFITLNFRIDPDGTIHNIQSYSKDNKDIERSMVRMLKQCAPFPKIPKVDGKTVNGYEMVYTVELLDKSRKKPVVRVNYSNY